MDDISNKIMIEYFLRDEIYNGMYQEIVRFINNIHIRNGEFECNRHIIKKIDHNNFLILLEDEYQDGTKEIPWATAFYKFQLLDLINTYAKKKGLVCSED